MCIFKSGLILKDSVFVPDYDSHQDMLAEFKIEDTKENAERLFVRAELTPPTLDVFSPIEKWKFIVDQDILPEWFVPEIDEKRMREAVAEYAKNHIFTEQGNLTFSDSKDTNYYIKNCLAVARGKVRIFAYGSSFVRCYENSTVEAHNNSTVIACDRAVVVAYDNSNVSAYNDSIINASDKSSVHAYDNSKVSAFNGVMIDVHGDSEVRHLGKQEVCCCDIRR